MTDPAPRTRAMLAAAAEEAVIALARSGDLAAFEELVRRRERPLRSMLKRLCRDTGLADDLCQEAFVQAWLALPSLRANAAFWSWLRRIAARIWLQHAGRQRLIFTDDPNLGDASVAPAYGDGHDLDAGLARLAPAVRACMVLAYQGGLSHAEIAAALRLPLGTVKSHVNRGTQALRHWFGIETLEE